MKAPLNALMIATVLLILSALVLGILNSGIGDLRDGSSDVADTGCDYQQSKVLNEPDTEASAMNSRCNDKEFQQTLTYFRELRQLNKKESSDR